jgi:hypothetical protein
MATQQATWLRSAALIVGLLALFTTVVAGVIDTRFRVTVLEKEFLYVQKTAQKVERQFDLIRDGLHKIEVEQAIMQQRLLDFLERTQ